jgi:chromosome segregation ATPase
MSKSFSSSAAHLDDAFMNYDNDDTHLPRLEDADTEYRKAQQELEALKARQQEVEQKRRELQLLEEKRSTLNKGRRELSDRLGRVSESVERQLDHLHNLMKELNLAATSYSAALEQVEALPADMSRARVEELDDALMVIEESESVFNKATRRLQTLHSALLDEDHAQPTAHSLLADDSPRAWLLRGTAFTLPLVLTLLVLLLIARWLFA